MPSKPETIQVTKGGVSVDKQDWRGDPGEDGLSRGEQDSYTFDPNQHEPALPSRLAHTNTRSTETGRKSGLFQMGGAHAWLHTI